MILTFSSTAFLDKFGFDLGIPFLCDIQSPVGLPYFNTSPGIAYSQPHQPLDHEPNPSYGALPRSRRTVDIQ